MIEFKHRGKFKKTNTWFQQMLQTVKLSRLDKYGRIGVEALSSATPVDSGHTADSWFYEIKRTSTGASIIWRNPSQNDGVLIVILLQYGHATKNGGYVKGLDFINPALHDKFEEIANDAWREVNS